MSPQPEAFLLLSLENTTLAISGTPSQTGTLGLECVSIPVAEALNHSPKTDTDRDVYLVLRLKNLETPIDPSGVIYRTDGSGWRNYMFRGAAADSNAELIVTVATPEKSSGHFVEDLNTFESILAQYAELRGPGDVGTNKTEIAPEPSVAKKESGRGLLTETEDLRGHLVMVNQDTGEIVGELDDKYRVREDPTMNEKGHEDDPVVLEIPEESEEEQDARAMEMFVRAIPADQQDWITKSATIVSHAISQTTNLLLTTITTASSYYIAHSAPGTAPTSRSPSGSPNPSGTTSPNPNAPPVPPRALVFLTSERTRKNLSTVHSLSGQAVKVSSSTVAAINGMIRSAVGGRSKKERTAMSGASLSTVGMEQQRRASPVGEKGNTSLAPPGFKRSLSPSSDGNNTLLPPPTYATPSISEKPGLPPRRSTSPAPPLPRRPTSPAPPLPPRTTSGPPSDFNRNSERIVNSNGKLSTRDRILFSADLILSTLDHSTRQVLDVGTESLGAVVGHKYGPDAAQSSLLMAGTARNVALVYVDMRGVGRRALIKRAGRQFVKGRVASAK